MKLNSYLLGELQEAGHSAHDSAESVPEPSLHCPVEAPVLWLSSKYSEFGNNTVKSYCWLTLDMLGLLLTSL